MHDESRPNWPSNLEIVASTSSIVQLGIPNPLVDESSTPASQDIEQFGIAGRTWEAAYSLRAFLTPPSSTTQHFFDPPCPLYPAPNPTRRRTILELGSGTGFAALAIAPQLLPTDTLVVTDLEEVLPLLEKNLSSAIESNPSIESILKVRPLEWGNPKHLEAIRSEFGKEGIDLILASDVVYFPFLYPSLLQTLLNLTKSEDGRTPPEVIFAYKTRSLVREQPFWESFGGWFDFTPVLIQQSSTSLATTTPPTPITESSLSNGLQLVQSNPLSKSSDPPKWTIFGESSEIYIFVCHRKSETYDLPIPDLENIMEGRKDERFENLLFGGLEFD